MPYRIGADVGGTFTDIVVTDDKGSPIRIGKVLTTPKRPDDAILEGVKKVLTAHQSDAETINHIIHGTTLFTNALIERKGAKTALITTRGFRDAIEIGREHRYDMYDLYMKKPEPLSPRYLRFEVTERMLANGKVLTPLDVDDVRTVISQIKAENVEAVAVCLIHSYANNAHEKQIAELLSQEIPDVAVSISTELVPEIREYDRTSTTLANVYVKGIAQSYLTRLQERLKSELDFNRNLFIMQSNGGLCEANDAIKQPVLCVESGPAAGAIAAAYYGELIGCPDLLSFDMGGTTAKACVIADGQPLVTNEFEVDRQYQFKKGSGLPIKVPVVEMIEIGTGGGSIARVDAMGRLSVGPDSAGSDPGPVAYGQGGVLPTITDADLQLGYLDPGFFLGGAMDLDVEGARASIHSEIGQPLNLSDSEAAWGIHQISNENMASAARIHAIERGKDVRKFPVLAFGGAGPVHAFGVARILRSPRVIYPLNAGVLSAIGFMVAPLTLQFTRSAPSGLDDLDFDQVNALISQMEDEGRQGLMKTIAQSDISFTLHADLRYQKQGYEVRTSIPFEKLSRSSLPEIIENFEQAYRAIYGHVMKAPIEVVSWRVTAYGPKPTLAMPSTEDASVSSPDVALKGYRRVYLPDQSTMDEVPVYDRYQLKQGMDFKGPAIIEERESTVVINGKATIHLDAFSNLIVDLV